jgi:hypothetical protein
LSVLQQLFQVPGFLRLLLLLRIIIIIIIMLVGLRLERLALRPKPSTWTALTPLCPSSLIP